MAESEHPTHGSDSPPLKLPSFVTNLFPFLKPKPSPPDGPKPTGDKKEPQNSTYESVSFPYNPPNNAEPLKYESEVSSSKTSNSLVIWQVYALGGFLVLKWAWARWNERNERSDKKDTTDDGDHRGDGDDEDDQTSHGHED
ncbi:hypothetical protein EUTSA_v10010807mg [Eutrema salsugineum]|uniref:Uncharacterized protein n=1 Tax=Eutrema salsugineum TaxID=72664 RepID=V4LS10_EUTSA|nr:uncharacterized protein LOC18021657 [Eutrema salsugineum]ESQ45277.1 hypothetical protein EUTSA_v10010807mg [Eutrema salsugineum]